MSVLSDFQAPLLNELPSTSVTDIGGEEIERRRQALQYALSYCLSAEDLAHTVKLCEQEFASKASFSVSEFCQRLFETKPQIQLDKESRLRLLRAMRQPAKVLNADGAMPAAEPSEPMPQMAEPSESMPQMPMPEPLGEEIIQLPSPEDSTSPELVMAIETPLAMPSPEDSTSPELFVLRYVNFGKEIIA